MASNINLSISNKRLIWSPLPPLLVHPNYRTEGLSKNQNKLSPDQISPWKDFENTARSFARGVTGNPTPGFNEISQEERFLVGNELGVQSRFVEHVGQTMAKIYDSLGYHVRFGDFQSGIPMKTSKGSGGNYPDLAIIAMDSRHMRIYGEVKTDWTFHPKNKKQSEEQFLAARLGQLARYMDDYHSRYGFMTTHGRTWFVKRASDNRFLVSKPIKADDKATDDSLSLRECFLFFGHLAREKGEGEEPMLYKKRIGLKLTTNKGADYSPRTLPGRAAKRLREDSSDSGEPFGPEE